LVGLYYFVRVSTALVIAPHANTKPLIANGKTAKKAKRWSGFFQQKEPVTGQDLVFVNVAIVNLLLKLELE